MSDIRKLVAAGVFGYAAGKSLIAKRLTGFFPAHDTYVEPFCGSAACFFVKSQSKVEVLSDVNPDVTGAFKAMKSLSPGELADLEKRDWVASAETFAKLRDSVPASKTEALHKFLYINHFSFGKNRKTFSPEAAGRTSGVVKRVALLAPRLKGAIIRTGDYGNVIKEFDGKDTFFFLDPPYPGTNSASNVGEKTFDEAKFRKVLDDIRGKFLLTYGTTGNLDISGFNVKRMRQARQVGRMNGPGSATSSILTHLVVSNFDIAAKSFDGLEFDDVIGIIETGDDGDRFMVSSGAAMSIGGLPRARAYKSEDVLSEYPREPGPLPAEVLLRFMEKSIEADLVFTLNDTLVGWTMAVQRAETIGEPGDVAKSFSAEGSRFFLPLTEGVPAREVGDEVATSVFKVDRPHVELGLQTDDAHEYFLSKGSEFFGTLRVSRPTETVFTRYPWLVTLMPEFSTPMVLKSNAPMPPEGISALPQSLECVVPDEFRYWEMKGADAVKARTALVASSLLAPGVVRMVEGEPRRVSFKAEIYEPEVLPVPAADWPLQRIAGLLPEGAKVVEVFTPDTVAKTASDGVLYFDAGEGACLDLIAKALGERVGDYVVTAMDSPAAREALAKMGRIFRFQPGDGVGADAIDRLFAASFGVRGVQWIGKADLSDGDLATSGGMVVPSVFSPAATMSSAERRRRRRTAKADLVVDDLFGGEREIQLTKAADTDERFVLGIVLEPDTVDAQNDIYSAEEVRSAAHKFMERFQNIGHMHKDLINSKAKILESFLAPVDFAVGDQQVKKGTWVMATRVSDDKLWKAVKSGELTGYSIGGSAKRVREATTKAMTKIEFQGIPITIDRPKGYVQSGRDEKGEKWSREYKLDYGYIPRTKGGDGDGLDVFMGPNAKAPTVFWATQKKADGTFDEYKLFMGFDTIAAAKKAYTDHIPVRFMGDMHEMSVEKMKALLNQEPLEVLKALAG